LKSDDSAARFLELSAARAARDKERAKRDLQRAARLVVNRAVRVAKEHGPSYFETYYFECQCGRWRGKGSTVNCLGCGMPPPGKPQREGVDR
jgi:hypothetical protein